MVNQMNTLSLLIVAIAALMVISCGGKDGHSILPAGVELREGDVVARRGMGLKSRVVCELDSTGLYSHIGIVARSPEGGLRIVHAVPGESNEGESTDSLIDPVRCDPPEYFFSSERAAIGAAWRYPDSIVAKRAAQQALRWYYKRVPFDYCYNDSDTTVLYCCQLVELAYLRAAGISLSEGRHQRLKAPGIGEVSCMFPSDIISSSHLRHLLSF